MHYRVYGIVRYDGHGTWYAVPQEWSAEAIEGILGIVDDMNDEVIDASGSPGDFMSSMTRAELESQFEDVLEFHGGDLDGQRVKISDFFSSMAGLPDTFDSSLLARRDMTGQIHFRRFRSEAKQPTESDKGWFGDSQGHSIAARGLRVPWRRKK